MTTLDEAKQELQANADKGTHCPCCGQFFKVYRRSLHHSVAAALIEFFKYVGGSTISTAHLTDVAEASTVFFRAVGRSGDFGKLRYWGLVESVAVEPPSDKKHSGLWRLTGLGKEFVLGNAKIPKYVMIANSELLGVGGEPVTIQHCLRDQFSYSELMYPTYQEPK